MEQRTKNNEGIALVESIIAISVMTIGVVAMLSLISRSLSLNRTVTERYIAANLAAEGIEIVKNFLSNNLLAGAAWNAGFPTTKTEYEVDYKDMALPAPSSAGRLLKFDGATYQYSAGAPSIYKRSMIVDPIGSPINELRVNSIVTWTSRGGARFSINLEDHFFNWRCPAGAPGC